MSYRSIRLALRTSKQAIARTTRKNIAKNVVSPGLFLPLATQASESSAIASFD
jgi:hypothetical protein